MGNTGASRCAGPGHSRAEPEEVSALRASVPLREVQYSSTVRRIVGPTILLAGGEYFDFLDPASCAFSIDDIAHGLSHICRFAGHCREFYSVAQHSVYVSQIVPPEHAFAGLMHDAAEAFVGDVAKPLKDLLPEYREIEQRVETALLERFGLALPLHPSIKEADIVMLATEQLALMRNRDDWEYTRGRQPADIDIQPMEPRAARAIFLERFEELNAIAAATGTAKTPQAVECEASQSGGVAASPKGNRR